MAVFLWCILLLVQLPFSIGAIPPNRDPFYVAPEGFEDTDPGTILRVREIASVGILGLLPTGVRTYQLLFRTTVIDDRPNVGVTTVFRPAAARTDRFVSFHTHYDFSSTYCNPSYLYQLGAVERDLIATEENLYLEAFLVSGHIVSSPDYEGPDAAFGVGRLSGQVTLDSMRAVREFGQTLGFSTDNPAIVGYGYSGGSIASGWAAQIQANYAPDLDIRGWVASGLVASIQGTALRIDGTLFAGFIPAVIDSFRKPSTYARWVNPVIDRIITPTGRAALDFASRNCLEVLFAFVEQSIFTTRYQKLGRYLFQEPTVARLLALQEMGVSQEETPTVPIYVHHARRDEIAPYEIAENTVERWCNMGASVEFVTLGAGGHLTSESLGFIGAFQFVQRAFAGAVQQGCTRSTRLDDNVNPLALGANLEPILLELIDRLAALGRADAGDLRALREGGGGSRRGISGTSNTQPA